jgi:hypothetical protein
MGILFTILFPNFLSTIILRQQVSEVVLDAPTVPVKSEHSGYMEEGTMQEWISNREAEKQNPLTPKANNGETELGNTINNPDARPENFGEDLQISNPY